jgi:hypothetical protein
MKTNLKTISAIAAGLSLSVLPVFAGTTCPEGGTGTKFRFAEVGGSMVDVGRMNDRLADRGLPQFSQYAASLGFGHNLNVGRLTFEHQLNGLMWMSQTAGGVKGSLWSGQYTSTTGFDVLPTKLPVRLYPYLGAGFGMTRLELYDNKRSFSDVVAAPHTALMLTQGTLLLTGGVGADFAVPVHKGAKTLGIGVRAGYMFDPTRTDRWWSNGSRITGGPEPLLNGVYGKLVFGTIKPVKHEKRDWSSMGKCEKKS